MILLSIIFPVEFIYPLQNNDERRECMNLGIVCGQTPILDLAAGVREHLAQKGTKKETLYVFKKFGTTLHVTLVIVISQLK